MLQIGDIVLGMDRPIIASEVRAACVQANDIPSLLLQRVARPRPRERLVAQFLLLLLRGRLFAEYIAPIFTGIGVPHLSPEQIRNFKIMLPPVQEQQAIVAFIEREIIPLTTAIARTEREITLMREFRTRLTADIVTGMLDVRAAAGRLPEAEEEPAEPGLDAGAGAEESGEESGEADGEPEPEEIG